MRRGTQAARVIPRSVSDSLNAADSPAGAMRALVNLIFDPSTPHVMQCRPAAVDISNFPGITAAGVVSAALQVGDLIYGMIASSLHAGHDQPFVYDIVTNSFQTVSGITSANTPLTPASTGDWNPPTMDMMGIYVIVTHPGFPGGAGAYFGWFDTTTSGSPAWAAGNTTGAVQLNAVPVAVKQFNNRAWFAFSKNLLVGTDALTLNVTNVTQVLTVGNAEAITTLAGLPYGTTSQGVLQALVIFKGTDYIGTVTGDFTTSNLAIEQITDSSGTKAPRSVVLCPDGLLYMDHDGLRALDFVGEISPVDPDVRVPFISALFPSRVSAVYNGGVYRICVQNGAALGSPYQEYWYDLERDGWTGPHTWRQDLVLAYDATCIAFRNDQPGVMFQSDVLQNSLSTFTELGSQLLWQYTTSPMGESGELYANSALQSTLFIAYTSLGQNILLTAQDVNGGVLAQAALPVPTIGALWGAFTWGAALWGPVSYGLAPVNIPWTNPLVFTTVLVQVTGASSAGLKLGALKMLYKILKYIP